MKTRALEAIGETGLRPLAAINEALAANDRVKYYLSLLQMALGHADHPEEAAVTLKLERTGAGIDEAALDGVIAEARPEGGGYRIPRASDLLARLGEDMRVMAAPVLASPARAASFAGRLEAVLATIPASPDDLVDARAIATLTRLGGSSDTLHQLVMDLHRQLNAMQAELAQEQLDGASVYGLDEADRPLVSAFMAGVNRTAPLKFGHPGLGTTATRSRDRLVIQNDVGETEAHVLVVHVEGLEVTLTYTDVHPERLAFFQSLLSRFAVTWETGRPNERSLREGGEPFTLTTGRFRAADEAECRTYLEWLGSRIVFLIDWNRARKALRGFLRAKDRLAVLRWAAQEEAGQRAFLQLGGAALINAAIEETAGSAMHFGDRLCDVIGDEEATTFVKFVLRTTATGLLAGQSQSLIRDRIFAELRGHFSNEERRLLRVAADHAALIFEIAVLLREGILAQEAEPDEFERLARNARRLEHEADQLVIAAREAVRRRPEYAAFQELLEAADDAADQLEDVVFLLGLLKRGTQNVLVETLRRLGEIVMDAAQAWVKASAEAAATVGADSEDFLVAIDQVVALEHQADDSERDLTRATVEHAEDFRQLHLAATIGHALEEATDALRYASLLLRDYVLNDDRRR